MKVLAFLPLLATLNLGTAVPMPSRFDNFPDGIIPASPFAEEINYRLPNDTLPISYKISLTTDIHLGEAGQTFTGEVRIHIYVFENTPQITLHYRQMTIENIALYTGDNPPVLIQDDITPAFEEDKEFLLIRPSVPLVENELYYVDVKYRGLLRDDNMVSTWLAKRSTSNLII